MQKLDDEKKQLTKEQREQISKVFGRDIIIGATGFGSGLDAGGGGGGCGGGGCGGREE